MGKERLGYITFSCSKIRPYLLYHKLEKYGWIFLWLFHNIPTDKIWRASCSFLHYCFSSMCLCLHPLTALVPAHHRDTSCRSLEEGSRLRNAAQSGLCQGVGTKAQQAKRMRQPNYLNRTQLQVLLTSEIKYLNSIFTKGMQYNWQPTYTEGFKANV